MGRQYGREFACVKCEEEAIENFLGAALDTGQEFGELRGVQWFQ